MNDLEDKWGSSRKLICAAANPEVFAYKSHAEGIEDWRTQDVPEPSQETVLMNSKLTIDGTLKEDETAKATDAKPEAEASKANEASSAAKGAVEEEAKSKPKAREGSNVKERKPDDGKAAEEGSKPRSHMSAEDELNEKHSILAELQELKDLHNIRTSKTFSTDDSLADLQYEIKRQLLSLEKSKGVRFMKQCLSMGASAVCALNDYAGPVLDLEGWPAEFNAELENFDTCLASIYRKHWMKRGSGMSPEAQLAMGLGTSLIMHHFKRKINKTGMGSWIGGGHRRPSPSKPPSPAPVRRTPPPPAPVARPSATAEAAPAPVNPPPSVLRRKRGITFPKQTASAASESPL